MAKVTFSDANNGLYGYSDLDDYAVTSITKSKLVLQYSADLAGRDFDAERSPWEITVKIKKGSLVEVAEGPLAGQVRYDSGKITKVTYTDQSGDTLVSITGVKIDAPLANFLYQEEPYRLYDYIVAGDSTFTDNADPDNGADISTGSGNDFVEAKAGAWTYIKDNGGTDTYQGHDESFDTVTYDQWVFSRQPLLEGITVKLNKGYIDGPDGLRDTVSSIEQVRGTAADDLFVGDGNYNDFYGLYGNDTLNGGDGVDRASYRRDIDRGGYRGIEADLAKGYVIDGFGTEDKLVLKKKVSTIEQIDGTDLSDVFKDDKGDNYFRGRDGDDKFCIGRGNDGVDLGGGANMLIVKTTNFGSTYVSSFDDDDSIEIRAASDLSDLTIVEESEGTRITVDGANGDIFLDGVFDLDTDVFLF